MEEIQRKSTKVYQSCIVLEAPDFDSVPKKHGLVWTKIGPAVFLPSVKFAEGKTPGQGELIDLRVVNEQEPLQVWRTLSKRIPRSYPISPEGHVIIELELRPEEYRNEKFIKNEKFIWIFTNGMIPEATPKEFIRVIIEYIEDGIIMENSKKCHWKIIKITNTPTFDEYDPMFIDFQLEKQNAFLRRSEEDDDPFTARRYEPNNQWPTRRKYAITHIYDSRRRVFVFNYFPVFD